LIHALSRSCNISGIIMTFRQVSLGLACVMTIAVTLCAQEQGQHPSNAKPIDSTNHFVIHLQEGFYQSQQVVIAVDGREVYRAIPKTRDVLGLATTVPITNASANPLVVFSIPSTSVTWSNRIDLAKGAALGISLTKNGQVRVLQSTNFYYD